jgi:hypothetical protein
MINVRILSANVPVGTHDGTFDGWRMQRALRNPYSPNPAL